MRINKYIASCGVASRRKADDLVAEGRVYVNGKKVTEPGLQIDPESDSVKVDGKAIGVEEKKVYVLLNKPTGYISTARDQFGRKSVTDLVKVKYRVYPVGRLDYDTSGLLILTNDGELTYAVTHPKHELVKTYVARIEGVPSGDELEKFRSGVDIGGFVTSRASISIISQSKDRSTSTVEIKIHEGKNRQVRKMCDAIGHKVLGLQRTAIGDLKLEGLQVGEWRYLSSEELGRLLHKKITRGDRHDRDNKGKGRRF